MIGLSLVVTGENDDLIIRKLLAVQNLNWKAIGERFEDVATEQNRANVLSGRAPDGSKIPPTKYRPVRGRQVKLKKTQRFRSIQSKNFGLTRNVSARNLGGGARLSNLRSLLPNNNLPPSVYKYLTGPPLAPRFEGSRIIQNYATKSTPMKDGTILEVGWYDVLDAKGEPFLANHFEGKGKLPRRDFRGLSTQAIDAMHRILEEEISRALVQ